VARTRKTSDTRTPGTPETQNPENIEDAVVLGETFPPDPNAPRPDDAPTVIEETAPEAVPEATVAEDVAPERIADEMPEPPREDSVINEREVELSDREPAPEPEPERVDYVAAEEPAPRVEERPAPPPPPPAPVRRGGSGVVPLIFGGLIAAAAGVGASRFVFPDGWPGAGNTDTVIADLRTAADAHSAKIAELESTLATLRDQVAAVPDPAASLGSLREELAPQISDAATAAAQAAERLGALDTQLAALTTRVQEIAQRPSPAGLDTASLDAELANFRQELSSAVDEARANIVSAQEEAARIATQAAEEAAAREAAAAKEAEETRAAAEAAAATAEREAAQKSILAALDSGEPYTDFLAGLDVPPALSGPAADGVPTLTELVDSYPEAARAALDASIRANVDGGAMDRFAAFLRVQTGARSLEPREGDDPDAILSRAEAAVRAGDLSQALTELSALPEDGQAAMAGWTQSARTRLDALEAAQGLTQN
jgi:hypothetical protein